MKGFINKLGYKVYYIKVINAIDNKIKRSIDKIKRLIDKIRKINRLIKYNELFGQEPFQ